MLDFLRALAASEGGRRFLLNLLEGLDRGDVAPSLAELMLREAAARPRTGPAWHPCIDGLSHVVFNDPDRYQFTGPTPSYTPAEWMTVKSIGDLLLLARENSGLSEADLKAALGVPDLGPNLGLSAAFYERFAEVLSETDVTFTLARCFVNPRAGGLRPAPSWYSRWCHYPFKAGPKPSADFTGRLRDYLGLPYADVPLFVVRTRRPTDVAAIGGHRPTVFEGIVNPLYKHKAPDEQMAERMGSAADLRNIRKQRPPQPIDGGPELVSQGIVFRSDDFLCEFVGVAPKLDYDVESDGFHEFLAEGMSMDDVLRRIVQTVTGGVA